MRIAAAEAIAASSSMSFSSKMWTRPFALSTIMPRQPSLSSSGAATRLRTPEDTMLSAFAKRASSLASVTSAATPFSVTSRASARE